MKKMNFNVVKFVVSIGLILALSLSIFAFSDSVDYVWREHPDDPISIELQRLETIAIEKNEQIFNNWALVENYIEIYDFEFPDFFGGTYINGNKNLVIQVTQLNCYIIEYFSIIIDITNVVFEEVRYSKNQLLLVQAATIEQMLSYYRNSLFSTISSVGLAIENNSVIVALVEPDVVFARNTDVFDNFIYYSAKNIFHSLSITNTIRYNNGNDIEIDIITIDVIEEGITRRVNPGNRITRSGTTPDASIGIWVRCHDDTSRVGVISTGHAWNVNQNLNVSGRRFGRVELNQFGGGHGC